VIKLGEHGAVALTDGSIHRRGSYDVPVVDTVGAGDAFAAGWLAEYRRDPADVTAMLETAVACGAYACTVHGDWEGAPAATNWTSSSSPARPSAANGGSAERAKPTSQQIIHLKHAPQRWSGCGRLQRL
jgi:hypothetical protein